MDAGRGSGRSCYYSVAWSSVMFGEEQGSDWTNQGRSEDDIMTQLWSDEEGSRCLVAATTSWLPHCCRCGDRGYHAAKGSGDVVVRRQSGVHGELGVVLSSALWVVGAPSCGAWAPTRRGDDAVRTRRAWSGLQREEVLGAGAPWTRRSGATVVRRCG